MYLRNKCRFAKLEFSAVDSLLSEVDSDHRKGRSNQFILVKKPIIYLLQFPCDDNKLKLCENVLE